MRKLVYLIMTILPVLAVSCTGNVDPDATGGTSGESGLTITVDKDIIQTGVDKAMKICKMRMPEYTKFSDTHESACWLNELARRQKGGNANG